MNNRLKITTVIYNVITLILLFLIIYLSLTSRTMSVGINNIDKFQHALAYAVLAFFFSLSLRSWGFDRFKFLLTILACALIGGALEIIQSKYGRMMELNDFIADVIGASIGCLIVKFSF